MPCILNAFERCNRDNQMNEATTCGRRCLACGAIESIGTSEPIWPVDWRCPACAKGASQVNGIPMFAPELADTVSGFDPRAFDELAGLEGTHFWFVARNRLIVGLARKFFPSARRFLEVGCGTGFVLQAMAESRQWERLVGSELHPTGLTHARRRVPQSEFVQMDAQNIPARGVFDLTGAFDVIEHIADDEAVLRGLRAATKTGGGTIITVPQHPWLWSRADKVAHHQRRYRRGELETKLRRNGFEILFSSSFTALLLPLMAASRLKDQKDAKGLEAYEFKLNPVINRSLLEVLRAEVCMTLAGIRWPAGGSRVVVAEAI